TIYQLFATDLAVVREGIHAVEGSVKVVEETTQDLTARNTTLEATTGEIHRAHKQLEQRLDDRKIGTDTGMYKSGVFQRA
ncbi:Hypothetical predicted protein, partial [Pelobates cultripes]